MESALRKRVCRASWGASVCRDGCTDRSCRDAFEPLDLVQDSLVVLLLLDDVETVLRLPSPPVEVRRAVGLVCNQFGNNTLKNFGSNLLEGQNVGGLTRCRHAWG